MSSFIEIVTPGHRRALLVTQILITILLVYVFIFLFDWNRVVETVASVRISFLFGALVCLAAILMLGAVNIWILLNAFTEISVKGTLHIYLMSWCTFLLLPGSAGDAVQVFLLKEAGVPYRDGGTVYITDKIVSLGAAILVAVAGGFFYFQTLLRPWVLLGMTALVGLMMTAAYELGRRSRIAWIERVLSFAGAPVLFYKDHPNRVRMNAFGTLTKLAFTALSHWLAFRAVGADVSFGVVFTVAVLAGLVAYVPIAFNGLGTVEFAAVTLYGVNNVPAHQVLASYLILRSGNILLAMIGLMLSQLLASKPSALLIQR